MATTKKKSSTLTLERLNQKIEDLAAKFDADTKPATVSPQWWHDHAGKFENDLVFDEIIRLGREQRRSLGNPRKRKRAGS